MAKDNTMSKSEIFNFVREQKLNLTPKNLVDPTQGGNQDIELLFEFVGEIMKLDYEQAPNYMKLRLKLINCILTLGESLNQIYDWSQEYEGLLNMQHIQIRNLKQNFHNSFLPEISSPIQLPKPLDLNKINAQHKLGALESPMPSQNLISHGF